MKEKIRYNSGLHLVEVAGKATLRKRLVTDRCASTGKGKVLVSSGTVTSTSFFGERCNETKKRTKKTPDEKYREHYLGKLNRYLDVAKRAKRTGHLSKGLVYHTTLTVNDDNLCDLRSPRRLSKKIKEMMVVNSVTGLGVLEVGSSDDGRLHAHILSNRRIPNDWWKYGHVKTQRIKKGSKAVQSYLKKTLYDSEKTAAYFAPRSNAVVTMTDRVFFSSVWKGSKDAKVVISPLLKDLERTVTANTANTDTTNESNNARTNEVTETKIVASLESKNYSTYTNSFLLRATIFMSCYLELLAGLENLAQTSSRSSNALDQDAVTHLANLPFDDFAKRIEIKHKGTCGYTLELNLDGANQNVVWSLFSFLKIDTKDHWLTPSHKESIYTAYEDTSDRIKQILSGS